MMEPELLPRKLHQNTVSVSARPETLAKLPPKYKTRNARIARLPVVSWNDASGNGVRDISLGEVPLARAKIQDSHGDSAYGARGQTDHNASFFDALAHESRKFRSQYSLPFELAENVQDPNFALRATSPNWRSIDTIDAVLFWRILARHDIASSGEQGPGMKLSEMHIVRGASILHYCRPSNTPNPLMAVRRAASSRIFYPRRAMDRPVGMVSVAHALTHRVGGSTDVNDGIIFGLLGDLNKPDRLKLEMELKTYSNNTIKESIRDRWRIATWGALLESSENTNPGNTAPPVTTSSICAFRTPSKG
ncbi:hypothetical protein IW262DRAFT_1298256 [Armillaria fumosa]|nr:hypothetical protein IW262DRAFT_1298256 [Armillaria fumosa]